MCCVSWHKHSRQTERVLELPQRVADALAASRHTVLLTGAGISAESGVPTFRQAQTGLWARYRPEDLATAEAFERDPQLVWDWYQWRRSLLSAARPNPAHLAIAALERLLPRVTLITQNVDGLHQRAGSTAVLEFHGTLNRNRCSIEHDQTGSADLAQARPPRCRSCGAAMRPDVVWFGEPIPVAVLSAATIAASTCDLFISAGTSAMVEPAASLAGHAKRNGALLVEINTELTNLSAGVDFMLQGPAATLLPALVAGLQ